MRKFELQFVLLLVIAVLCIFGMYGELVYGGIVEIPSTDGSGGPGLGVVSPSPTSLNQSFDFGGLHANAYATNYETDCYAGMNFWAEQGVNGRYYQYNNASSNFYTYNWDPRQFNYNFDVSFKVVDKAHYIPNMDLDMRQNMNVNMFGIDFGSWSDVQNRTEWFWEEDGNGGYIEWSILSDNPEVYAGFNLSPAQIDSMYLNPNFWSWEYEPEYDGGSILNISFSVHGYFLDSQFASAEENGLMFVSAVPEPATMLILGLGGLLIRKRR